MTDKKSETLVEKTKNNSGHGTFHNVIEFPHIKKDLTHGTFTILEILPEVGKRTPMTKEKLEELIQTTKAHMFFPEEYSLYYIDEKIEEFERPIHGGIDSVTCEVLCFALVPPDEDDAIMVSVELIFEKEPTSFLEIEFMFPDRLPYIEDYGALGVLEVQNRETEAIVCQAIEVLKERSDLKKYYEALNCYN